MSEAIARVHVDEYDPEVYRGANALELAQTMAQQMRKDFPDAVVGVSHNSRAGEEWRAEIRARYGLDPETHDSERSTN